MYVITLKLPDGINYYCGIKKHPQLNIMCPEWDTDKRYAKDYETKEAALIDRSYLRQFIASARAKVKLKEPFSKN